MPEMLLGRIDGYKKCDIEIIGWLCKMSVYDKIAKIERDGVCGCMVWVRGRLR
jgi:hypothetical protein